MYFTDQNQFPWQQICFLQNVHFYISLESIFKMEQKTCKNMYLNELVTSSNDFKRLHNQGFFRQLKRKIMDTHQY